MQWLSRDSSIDQRSDASLLAQGGHSFVDGEAERLCVCAGLVNEMKGLEIVPDRLDVVEFCDFVT